MHGGAFGGVQSSLTLSVLEELFTHREGFFEADITEPSEARMIESALHSVRLEPHSLALASHHSAAVPLITPDARNRRCPCARSRAWD